MNGTIQQASKTVREVSQFWAWKYDAQGYNKTSAGPCYGADAYQAAGEARRVWGPGRYMLRQGHANGPIVLKFC